MTTTDYTTLTPEQWEDLGRRLREATAEVRPTVQAEVVTNLQRNSIFELRSMLGALVAQRAAIAADAARRTGYVNAVIEQIDGLIRG